MELSQLEILTRFSEILVVDIMTSRCRTSSGSLIKMVSNQRPRTLRLFLEDATMMPTEHSHWRNSPRLLVITIRPYLLIVMLLLLPLNSREMQSLRLLVKSKKLVELSGNRNLSWSVLSVKRDSRSTEPRKKLPELNASKLLNWQDWREKNKSRNGELTKKLLDSRLRKDLSSKNSREKRDLNRSALNRKLLKLNMKREWRWKESKEKRDLRK